MKDWQRFALAGGLLAFGTPTMADTNVTFGKTVTLNGTFGSDAALASTVTDGLFRPEGTGYQDGTVYWNGLEPSVEVDLGGTYVLNSLIVQADDNDAYLLDYRDTAGTWNLAWSVPNKDFVNGNNVFGLQTRPNPLNDAERYFLPASITATALRLHADPAFGDNAYAVSEIQAFGTPVTAVPEPGAVSLLAGIGVGGLFLLRRRAM